MRKGSRLSYDELRELVCVSGGMIENNFLKNIYHYRGHWMFKFRDISIIFDGLTCWVGEFQEREDRNLHSICIKLRKEIGDRKCLGFKIVEGNRVVIMEFEEYYVCIECFAKGNLILVEKETKRIKILTRIYGDIRHGMVYNIGKFYEYHGEYIGSEYSWVGEEIKKKEGGEFKNIIDGSRFLWNYKRKEKESRKKKKTREENLRNQRKKWEDKSKMLETAIEIEDDMREQHKMYQERKEYYRKIKVLDGLLNEKKEDSLKIKREKRILEIKWYHKYYWWRTKHNFLVIGGKNATENEYIVKHYLGDKDYYFHTEDMGSGSFIMITEGKDMEGRTPNEIDFYDAAEGVFSLSKYWNLTKEGKVFYVHGSQVSKSVPTGMNITKGSFMIYGKKQIVSIHQTILGYGLWEGKELMLAPYRVIQRLEGEKIKISPKQNTKKMKGKIIKEFIEKKMNINVNEIPFLFSKPCILF